MERVPTGLLVALVLLAAPMSPARGQTTPGGDTTRDSAAVRDAAEEAQSAFEQARIRRLPWTWDSPPHPCDETVGRFCFWHGEVDGWTPTREDSGIVGERERLLGRLADAAKSLPGDGWITGQRVRYLVEAGRPADAVAVARACRTEPWWCRALRGYALHAAGEFAAAGDAFDRALAAMTAPERDRWTDLELLLDRDLRGVWRRLGGGARAAFARQLWWLADPLWSVAGNERRTEHMARLVVDQLQARARSPYDVQWGPDLRELTIRYGWPVGWERVRGKSGALGDGSRPGIVGHDAPKGRGFVPPHDVFVAPGAARGADWPLDPPAPRETYAPAYADSVVELTPQIAVFRRGDAARVVAAWELGADGEPTPTSVERVSPAADPEPEAALLVARDPDAPPAAARARCRSCALVVDVPWESALVSAEARAGRLAGRARRGLPLRELERPPLSDLLLLERPAPLPASLDSAVPFARRSYRVRSGERIGVFFELYPPEGSRSAEISITLRDERGGFWRGLAAGLGLSGRRQGEVAVSWIEEFPAGTAVLPRALALDLPPLAAGAYALELAVTLPDATPSVATLPLEVR
jgi:hypothetical protein